MIKSGFFKAINEEICECCDNNVAQGEIIFSLMCQTVYNRSDILICEKCALRLRKDILEQNKAIK